MSFQTIVEEVLLRHRRFFIVFFNLALSVFTFLLAFALRYDFEITGRMTLELVGFPILLLLFFRLASYSLFDLNCGYWRYVSTHDAVNLVKAHLLSSVCFMAVMGALRFEGFPRSVPLIELALSVLLAAGMRILVRLVSEAYFSRRLDTLIGPARDVVIIGGSVTGQLLIKTLKSQETFRYNPVAVFDDDGRLWKQTLHGVPVIGAVSQLRKYLTKNPRVSGVIVATSNLPKSRLDAIEEMTEEFDVSVQCIRNLDEILSDSFGQQNRVTAEELLDCEVKIEHEKEIQQALGGKRVLVTGAGGSIGSELVRQVLNYNPGELVLVEKSEFNLYSVEQEIHRYSLGAGVKKQFMLGDIANRARMNRIFEKFRPEIVFHAAAYKHVPLLESNVHEGFVNNVIGTRTLLEVSQHYGVQQFVLISTDKAVDPSSVMGCTKRIAELMVSRASDFTPISEEALEQGSEGMGTAVVRFGNVINSAGSVIPLFEKQLQMGGPLTVTHEKMERYFMSIREAVRLVMTAGTLGDKGEVYLLDMGKPIKILDVAKKLRALFGKEDIPIVISGLRPGEKLTERLYSTNEERSSTRFRKVFSVRPVQKPILDIFSLVKEIETHLPTLSNNQLAQLLHSLVSHEADPESLGRYMDDSFRANGDSLLRESA